MCKYIGKNRCKNISAKYIQKLDHAEQSEQMHLKLLQKE